VSLVLALVLKKNKSLAIIKWPEACWRTLFKWVTHESPAQTRKRPMTISAARSIQVGVFSSERINGSSTDSAVRAIRLKSLQIVSRTFIPQFSSFCFWNSRANVWAKVHWALSALSKSLFRVCSRTLETKLSKNYCLVLHHSFHYLIQGIRHSRSPVTYWRWRDTSSERGCDSSFSRRFKFSEDKSWFALRQCSSSNETRSYTMYRSNLKNTH